MESLFSIISDANKEYLEVEQELNIVLERKKNEILTSTKKIEESYQEELSSLGEKCSELQKNRSHYYALLEKYSTFSSRAIGNVLARLICEFERRDFVFYDAIHELDEMDSTVFGYDMIHKRKPVYMIVDRANCQHEYIDDERKNNKLRELEKNKKAFILVESEHTYSPRITFYRVNRGKIESCVHWEEFPYVKEFIDGVIQYRLENQLDSISEIRLFYLMEEFIEEKRNKKVFMKNK